MGYIYIYIYPKKLQFAADAQFVLVDVRSTLMCLKYKSILVQPTLIWSNSNSHG